MTPQKKKKIDNLWKGTRVWNYIKLISEDKYEEAQALFLYIPEEYKGTAVEVNMFVYEATLCRELVLAELTSYEEYIEYLKTFDEKMLDALYRTDLFDSYMAQRLS